MINQNSNFQPGELLKLLLTLKGIKQNVAAKKLGVTQQAISKLHSSKTFDREKFYEIAELFNFTPEEIEAAKKFLPR